MILKSDAMVINISTLLFPGRQCLQGVTEATMGRGRFWVWWWSGL
jgi:hypothetical protein